jgi:CRP-like cAMP-binding protein
MVVSGLAMTAAPLASLPVLRRQDRDFADPAVAQRFQVLERVAMISPLPRLGLERLARRAVPVTLEDGEVAVRQGDRPDRYAVVAHGEVAVEQDGREVRVLGPGDGFGEVALLGGQHRTATVVSRGRSEVLWLDGRDFVAAVTGHREADAEVHQTIGRYLDEDAARRGDRAGGADPGRV